MASVKNQASRTECGTSIASRRKHTRQEDCPVFPNKKNVISLRKTNVKAAEHDEFLEYPQSFSPTSSVQSFSEGSQESQSSFMSKVKTLRSSLGQNERDATPVVVTRSMSKQYASVGAVHNQVDLREELRVRKKWSVSSAYCVPDPPTSDRELRDVVTRSFNQVLNLCRDVAVLKKQTQATNLSPFTNSRNLNDELTLNLNQDFQSHKIINIVAVNEDTGSVTIQSKDNARDTITLYSGQTYFLDGKYFANDDVELIDLTDSPNLFDPRVGLKNDHDYSAKKEKELEKSLNETESKDKPSNVDNIPQFEFNIEGVLNSLLFNTARLKCLVCNETPQEIIELLEKAKHNC